MPRLRRTRVPPAPGPQVRRVLPQRAAHLGHVGRSRRAKNQALGLYARRQRRPLHDVPSRSCLHGPRLGHSSCTGSTSIAARTPRAKAPRASSIAASTVRSGVAGAAARSMIRNRHRLRARWAPAQVPAPAPLPRRSPRTAAPPRRAARRRFWRAVVSSSFAVDPNEGAAGQRRVTELSPIGELSLEEVAVDVMARGQRDRRGDLDPRSGRGPSQARRRGRRVRPPGRGAGSLARSPGSRGVLSAASALMTPTTVTFGGSCPLVTICVPTRMSISQRASTRSRMASTLRPLATSRSSRATRAIGNAAASVSSSFSVPTPSELERLGVALGAHRTPSGAS